MKLPRLRLAFSLRTSLVLFTAICLALVAFSYWLASVKRQRDAVALLRAKEYDVFYHFEDPNLAYGKDPSEFTPPKPPGSEFVRERFGIDAVAYVTQVQTRTAAPSCSLAEVMPALRTFERLQEFDTFNFEFTDTDLREIAHFKALHTLRIAGDIRAPLDPFFAETNAPLEVLHISNTGPPLDMSDECARLCLRLSQLRFARWYGVRVMDEGWLTLAKLPNLRVLHVDPSPVSNAAFLKFRDQRPDVEISTGHLFSLPEKQKQ